MTPADGPMGVADAMLFDAAEIEHEVTRIMRLINEARRDFVLRAIDETDFDEHGVLRIVEETHAVVAFGGPGDLGSLTPNMEVERYRRRAPPQDAYDGPCRVYTVTEPWLEHALPRFDRERVEASGLGEYLPDDGPELADDEWDLRDEYCRNGVHHVSRYEGDRCPVCDRMEEMSREREEAERER